MENWHHRQGFFRNNMHFKPELNKVALFASTNYNTYVNVNITLYEMTQVICVTDTGVGPSIDSKSILRPTWTPRIKRETSKSLDVQRNSQLPRKKQSCYTCKLVVYAYACGLGLPAI